MSTITSANSVFTLSVPQAFPTPITVQKYAADNAFTVDSVDFAETMMGVDGHMSAGYVPAITPMTIELMPDSDSISLFDTWLANQKAVKEVFLANGVITLPSTQKSYILTNGVLKKIKQIPDAKKVLQSVQYGIDWESVQVVPLS
jgi:hypothetical protein